MRAGRPPLPSGYKRSGTTEPVLAAFDGYIAYCGLYRVEEEIAEVVHIVEASLYPNWVGTEQRRRYRFDGGRLVLSAPVFGVSGNIINELTWQRVTE